MAKSPAKMPDHTNCLNCGASLTGQYCGTCGQRARGRLISMWELLQDAFGDLFEIDSRLWRTLVPLLTRPGRLTLDYLEGKRARYMPPFRMYLVLSVVFFVVAFFNPQEDLNLLYEVPLTPTPEESIAMDEEAAEAREEDEQDVDEVLRELQEDGVLTAEQAVAAKEASDNGVTIYGDGDDGFNFNMDEETGECTVTGIENLPGWLQRRLTKERLEDKCEEIDADGGKGFVRGLLDNIPVTLIVLLPLMALVLKVLYPLSRRYFVEHLLFFVHFHSFFFLILTLQILFMRFVGLIHLPEAIGIIIVVVASFYVPVYLFKSMRLVYGQGFFVTFLKYIALVFAYLVGASLTMLTAMSLAFLAV